MPNDSPPLAPEPTPKKNQSESQPKTRSPISFWVMCFALIIVGPIPGIALINTAEKVDNSTLKAAGIVIGIAPVIWAWWQMYLFTRPVLLHNLYDTSRDRFCFSMKNAVNATPFLVLFVILSFVGTEAPTRPDNLLGTAIGTFLMFLLAGFGGHFVHRFLRWRATRWQEKQRGRNEDG